MARMIYNMSARRMVHEFGAFLEQQLNGHEMTAGKVGLEFLQIQADLAGNLISQLTSSKEVGMAEGKLKWIDVQFYEDIKNFHYQLLHRLGSNRKDVRYQDFFPGGLTEIRKMNLAEQIETVADMLDKLGESEEFGDLAPILQTSYDEIFAAQKAVEEAEDRLDKLKGAEKSIKARWEVAYRNTRDELKITFDQNKKMVDAFFREVRRRPRKEESTKPVTAAEVASETPEEGGGDG